MNKIEYFYSKISSLSIKTFSIFFPFQKAYAWASSESGHINNNNTSTNNNNNNTESNNQSNPSNSQSNSGAVTSSTTTSSSGITSSMPVPGGVQGQNPTQGLVHWMSAVMAEHMTSNSHHDPAVGMHYMWNGAVDVSIH